MLAEHAAAGSAAGGFRVVAAQALTVLLDARLTAGDLAAAREHGRRALELHRPPATGHRYGEAGTARLLGDVLRAAGDPAAADRSRQHAVDLFTAIGATGDIAPWPRSATGAHPAR